jgi:hypothetical protein
MKVKLCAFLVIALAIVPLAGAQEFVTNIVDFSGYSTVSLVVDSNNIPLVVYHRNLALLR